MKEIQVEAVTRAVKTAFLEANVDVIEIMEILKEVKNKENSPIAKGIMDDLIQNAQIAKENAMPACQDTGMAVVFIDVGQDVHIVGGDLTTAINEGVRLAYDEGCFRKSVVDPLSRENTKDNTPAIIHYNVVSGDKLTINALPKGFGSENMSAIAMLTPAAGKEGILKFVLDTVKKNGANACPPLVVGVGIGGTFEQCAINSKKALMADLKGKNPDNELCDMEEYLLGEINKMDIGAMGLGGSISALKVSIVKSHTHIAGLPVAVNMMCHSLRHKEVVL